jgi:hypothetical protein
VPRLLVQGEQAWSEPVLRVLVWSEPEERHSSAGPGLLVVLALGLLISASAGQAQAAPARGVSAGRAQGVPARVVSAEPGRRPVAEPGPVVEPGPVDRLHRKRS